jgi:two-component system, chemotaxis family, CheB/CheR fusion protein
MGAGMLGQSKMVTDDHPFELSRLCRCFFALSPQPMIVAEGDTHVVRYVNDAFARLVGKERAELIDHPFAEAVPESAENGCLSLLDRVFRTGTPEVLIEQEHRRTPTLPTTAGAHPDFWSYSAWAILSVEQRPSGVMIQVTDATAAATFREQVTAMNETLVLSATHQHEVAATEEKLNAALRTSIEDKDYFVAVLSHELRTPLTPALMAVSVLEQDERLDEETRATLMMVRRNIALEARLIDDLLDMTRIARGKMQLERRPVDLATVIERAVEVCRGDLEAAGLALDLEVEDGAHVVVADAERLEQVFWNLLRNSIKFTPPGGRVRVRCHRQGKWAMAEVSDTGMGIDAGLLPRVFDAFEQGEKGASRKVGGLGLGLAITRTIVELHDGAITAHSDGRARGATFAVKLPLAVGARVVRDKAKRSRAGRALKILLVEDHADTGRTLRRLLVANGHTIEWACDVASALRLAEVQAFDLLLSDLGLPDGTGHDLMRILRRQGSTLPGIVISGYGMKQDLIRSREAGFAAHLIKPVSLEKLEQAIVALTG